MVAGETSGDSLGAALIEALKRRFPDAQFAGVAGPRMKAAGCVAWHGIEELSVMGLTEVIAHLPKLLRLRSELVRRLTEEWRPDVFIGIDFKEFNLGLARKLKAQGLSTVQYVSPQLWAWRQGRARTMGGAVDLVLCLFPFEPPFYREHGVRAAFVGHPLADQIPLDVDGEAARGRLGIDRAAKVLAILPGSRRGEVDKLGAPFAGAAEKLSQRFPGLVCIAPMVTPALRESFAKACAEHAPTAKIRLIDGDARTALAAADVALVASGTATLEAALLKRPMVVAYKLNAITAWVLRTFKVVKVEHFSQPNLLAGEKLVDEFFQEEANPETLSAALADWLTNPARVEKVRHEFTRLHELLRCDGAERASAEIAEILTARTATP
jgi:lipid-A-disaccharide synthase